MLVWSYLSNTNAFFNKISIILVICWLHQCFTWLWQWSISRLLYFACRIRKVSYKYPAYRATFRLMAENVIAPPREFRKLILSKRGFQAASFNRCLRYGRWGVSIWQPVTYVTILNLEKKSLSYRKKAYYSNYWCGLHIDYLSYI